MKTTTLAAVAVASAIIGAGFVILSGSTGDEDRVRDGDGYIRMEYAWEGEDFVLTVTSDPQEPLDCRWGLWFRLRGMDVARVNLTSNGACGEASDRVTFTDVDGDGRLSNEDRVVIRGLRSGEEDTTGVHILRWGVPAGGWGGNGWLLAEEPTIRVSWERAGSDVHVTVTEVSHERPLDSRWGASAWLEGNWDTYHAGINMTSEFLPYNDLVPDRPPEPRMAFEDVDRDGWLTVGDRWVLRAVPEGAEGSVRLGLSYWGLRYYEYGWNGADPSV